MKHSAFRHESAEVEALGDATCETQAALDAGLRLQAVAAGVTQADDDGVPFQLVPDGFTRESVEAFLPTPVRKRGEVQLNDAASFIGYVNRFKNDSSIVFASLGQRRFDAVLDYHEPAAGKPAWGQHRAHLECKTTDDWNVWIKANGHAMKQVEFARFLERNLPCIAKPEGAAIIEMVLFFEAKKAVNFRSNNRLQDGTTQLTYDEVIETATAGSTKAGDTKVPEQLALVIEPFEGAGPYRVDAYLRYRIDSGVLTMWIELIRPEDVLKAAFDKIREDITAGIGAVPVLAGATPTIGL